ncbi:MAG: hypothetical protein KGL62_02875 [Bradyrhizobium sp.]|uniref:hypothetical protein n=1 Tax=Bradyrhizobium sp. TaxID=376 RepID=UPI0023943557|nr:hypothetical protein [Bradyrhizobium sp.]MDE2601294.1 hypothetical protein [Bradyrhizobium sp.]
MVSETLVRDSLLWSRFEIRCLHRRFGAASAAVAPIGIAGSFASGYACARFVGEVFREPDGIVYGPITMDMAYCGHGLLHANGDNQRLFDRIGHASKRDFRELSEAVLRKGPD